MTDTLISKTIIDKLPEHLFKSNNLNFCRVPGRVNLIGEHTDYNGFSVLPITINKEVHCVFSPRDDNQVHLYNENPQFPHISFSNGLDIPPSPTGSWDNYIKAGIVAINKKFKVKKFPGFNLFINSTLPIATGLSSSSALVITASLAYLKILGKELHRDISRLELAELMAEGEHYVGTRGGGMDQTVILNGEAGFACKIDFFPIRTSLIPLFQDYIFIICDSTIRAPKTGSCLHKYNAGPKLCSLACALIQRHLQKEYDIPIKINRLSDLWSGELCMTYKEIMTLAEQAIPKEYLSLKEIAYLLNMSPKEVRNQWLGEMEEPEKGFPIRLRVRHVITEHKRVELSRDALLANDAYTFGMLMNDSHFSCAQNYEISTPELDTLTQIARKYGAIGSRLTGAGFGGCTVNLVPRDKVNYFMENVEKQYYQNYLGLTSARGMFIAETSPSASYISVD